MLQLENFHRGVGEVLRRVGHRLDPVLVGTAAPGAADHVHDDEGALILPLSGEANDGVAAFAGSGNARRDDLCESPEHRIHYPIAGERARGDRGRRPGVQDAALRHLHGDAAEHPFIVRHIGRQRAANAQVGAGFGVGERRVDRRPNLP